MNKENLMKRGKSFMWRGGMMIIALGMDFAAQSLADFNLSPQVIVVLGLILGEISKQLNSK